MALPHSTLYRLAKLNAVSRMTKLDVNRLRIKMISTNWVKNQSKSEQVCVCMWVWVWVWVWMGVVYIYTHVTYHAAFESRLLTGTTRGTGHLRAFLFLARCSIRSARSSGAYSVAVPFKARLPSSPILMA